MAETGVENSLYTLFTFIVFLVVVAILLKYVITPEMNFDPSSVLDFAKSAASAIGKYVGNFIGNIVI